MSKEMLQLNQDQVAANVEDDFALILERTLASTNLAFFVASHLVSIHEHLKTGRGLEFYQILKDMYEMMKKAGPPPSIAKED